MFTKSEWDEFVTHFFDGLTAADLAFTATVLVAGAIWLWSRWKWEQAALKELAQCYKYMIVEYEKAPPELKRRLDEWAATLRSQNVK